ncbi:hypothetical protein GJAV_G00181590 [Gymnothorax javanicus]|nr:hypothetical protein GJAV_G00181590 [Gymnothorax javanicus]
MPLASNVLPGIQGQASGNDKGDSVRPKTVPSDRLEFQVPCQVLHQALGAPGPYYHQHLQLVQLESLRGPPSSPLWERRREVTSELTNTNLAILRLVNLVVNHHTLGAPGPSLRTTGTEDGCY